MSQRATQYVQSLEHLLTESEYAVAQALAALARDEDDVAEATMRQIAQAVGITDRWARHVIRVLERHGLVIQVYQQTGLRRARTTYTFVELVAERPTAKRDLATIISLSKAMRRKTDAMRQRAEDQLKQSRDPLLLATVYEEMARTLREESARAQAAEQSPA